MSDFISKIGHLDPRFYSVIYCAIPGVQMSGVQISGVQISGVQMSRVQMSGVQMYPTRCGTPVVGWWYAGGRPAVGRRSGCIY